MDSFTQHLLLYKHNLWEILLKEEISYYMISCQACFAQRRNISIVSLFSVVVV